MRGNSPDWVSPTRKPLESSATLRASSRSEWASSTRLRPLYLEEEEEEEEEGK